MHQGKLPGNLHCPNICPKVPKEYEPDQTSIFWGYQEIALKCGGSSVVGVFVAE